MAPHDGLKCHHPYPLHRAAGGRIFNEPLAPSGINTVEYVPYTKLEYFMIAIVPLGKIVKMSYILKARGQSPIAEPIEWEEHKGELPTPFNGTNHTAGAPSR